MYKCRRGSMNSLTIVLIDSESTRNPTHVRPGSLIDGNYPEKEVLLRPLSKKKPYSFLWALHEPVKFYLYTQAQRQLNSFLHTTSEGKVQHALSRVKKKKKAGRNFSFSVYLSIPEMFTRLKEGSRTNCNVQEGYQTRRPRRKWPCPIRLTFGAVSNWR